MATALAVRAAPHPQRLHPLPIRIMHWTNVIAMFIMITSGWKIYNDDVLFGWLRFPDAITPGPWAQHGLQWHFFGMWILVLNGLTYVTYGFATGRLRRMLLPIRVRDLIANIRDALRFHLAHDDPTQYNMVQRLLYIGVLLTGVLIVLSGLAIWKPVQFSELLALFGSFQTARLVHFLCMSAIVAFVAVHVALALLVPHTLVAMVTGGPVIADAPTRGAKTAPVQVAEAAPVQVAEVAPAQVAEAAPVPVAETAPAQVAQAAPAPTAEATSESVADAAPGPAAESAPVPATELPPVKPAP
jgi:thiosulfate reductase cytochrome b subunit